ncbi:hypothetical protein PN437_10855 [Microcystis aeruginosa CS-564/01]|nr:hypothetical protein [Microcystis aeruginosa CS-564/01]
MVVLVSISVSGNDSNQLSVISYQLSVISYQLSVISYQLPVISYQLSVIDKFSYFCCSLIKALLLNNYGFYYP